MELRHLRYFVAVAEELSFRRAAHRLHVAQPSLSRQVRDLEEEIGERLLERDRQHVALTEAGRALLSKARELLAGAEEAITAAREVGSQARGALRIGNVGTLVAQFLPGSLAAFRRRFPQVDIEIFEMMMDEQVAALLAGAIQVGFLVRVPGVPVVSRLRARPVLTCAVAVALPTGHPMAADKTLSLKALAGEKFLDLQKTQGAGYGRWVRSVCEQVGGFTPRFRLPAVANTNALLGLVAAGEGLAFLPEAILGNFPRSEGWVSRPLRPTTLRFVLDAVWNPANPSRVLSSYLSLLPEASPHRHSSQAASAHVVRFEPSLNVPDH